MGHSGVPDSYYDRMWQRRQFRYLMWLGYLVESNRGSDKELGHIPEQLEETSLNDN